MLEPQVDPMTTYGCLTSIKFFGEHITTQIVIPKLESIVSNNPIEGPLSEIRLRNYQTL
jgi:hypothetical protein